VKEKEEATMIIDGYRGVGGRQQETQQSPRRALFDQQKGE
jgi:hypothetical protein